MKEKIVSALKTEYANLGLGQKAFDGVASFLEKTVTDEAGIDAAIKEAHVSALLKSIQGETDTLRTAKSTAEAALADYKQKHPEKQETNDSIYETRLKTLEDQLKEQKEQFAQKEKELAVKGIKAQVAELMKKNGSTNEFILELVMNEMVVKDGDTVEALATANKAVYDAKFTKAYGNGVLPRRAEQHSEQYKKGDYNSIAESLRKRGLLPKKENQ